eukprot:TRINITY_DN51795_c0_g1_i1.p1 TRINITY_DN51795_c0_g1~~TRINITY_DN51795_c0_g1_i1.p1  ORF type:complete len:100 (+),score=9.52 TRINITY_DN51795_c0_g1_i1:129-428(+)
MIFFLVFIVVVAVIRYTHKDLLEGGLLDSVVSDTIVVSIGGGGHDVPGRRSSDGLRRSTLDHVEHIGEARRVKGDGEGEAALTLLHNCLLYTSPSPRDS